MELQGGEVGLEKHTYTKKKKEKKSAGCDSHNYSIYIYTFLSFFPLMTKKMKKLVCKQKQMILTSKRHAEHPFTGQNTQHMRFARGNYKA